MIPPRVPLNDNGLKDIMVAKWELEHQDMFHLKNFYKRFYAWLSEEGWEDLEGGNTPEYLYWERHRMGVNEHHWWWRLMMVPEGNSYYMYYFKINFQTLYVDPKSKEIMDKGFKTKSNTADLIIRFESWLILDYKNKWPTHPILKYFENYFLKRMYKHEREALRRDLYIRSYKCSNMLKAYLKLKSPGERPKEFFPDLGKIA